MKSQRNGLQRCFLVACFSVPALIAVATIDETPKIGSVETQISLEQIKAIFQVPSVQARLNLSGGQISEVAAIDRVDGLLSFTECISKIEPILDQEQIIEFKKLALAGLMVRAFSVTEVRNALELTKEQVNSISAIQVSLRQRLKPFQDQVSRGGSTDPIGLDRDTKKFHNEAYLEAIRLLTTEQMNKWEAMSSPSSVHRKEAK